MEASKKNQILILGSTGSIGQQALEVVRMFPEQFEVVGLSAKSNAELLMKQAEEFSVQLVHIDCQTKYLELVQKLPNTTVLTGQTGLDQLISSSGANIALLAFVGESGVCPAEKILEAGINLALATKEVMVIDGERMMKLAQQNNCQIYPVDSEHSAIWQCIRSGEQSEIQRIWLTCSGGPFRDQEKWPPEKFKTITKEQALKHPNWEMGQKISIDSATLMNKAFELIETVRFFNIPHQDITIVIHPESFLHSAVEFCDGSVIGQIGTTDMRTPIAYALFYPQRPNLTFPKFDFFGKSFQFSEVDEKRFPSIRFARIAIEKGLCAELNRANDNAVEQFLQDKIFFDDIFRIVADSIGEEF